MGWYYNALRERNGDNNPARIVIGKDTRRSSYMFEYSLVAGLTASGADAYLLHVTTTPSVAYIARVDDFDCGIMISASHNPYYDNGIKLIDCYGEKMPEKTLLLVENYIDGKLHVFDKDWPELPFAHRDHIGCTVDYVAGRNRYMGYLISLGIYSFKGVKVGLDCANAGKVPSPAARKLQSGAKLSLHFRKSDEPLWSAKAVDRILHNEVYIGKLVQGKTRRLDYRSKKKMNVPMRDWVIVDNTHEAIIPAEQFELVRRILETETRRPNNAETVALFAGFLYCGDCGSRLVRRSASYKGKRYIYYQCSGSKQNKGSCTSHNLRDEKLHNIVRNALQMQM